MAAQDTLKNLFGSLVVFTDKPFGLGDRINYDGHDGTIEEVGLRSTRLRRLDGHQVTIPNGELANKSIHNIAKRPFIRRIFTIGVTYDTSPDKVKEAKEILEDILRDHEGLDPKGELLRGFISAIFLPHRSILSACIGTTHLPIGITWISVSG